MIRYAKNNRQIVTLTLDMSQRPVNLINHEIGQAFLPVLEQLAAEKAKGQLHGVIITSAKKTFLTGGDLDYLFEAPDAETVFGYAERIKKIFRQIESLGVPVAAALNGTALGSGLELALSCHYRIACENPHAKFGFPEVTLGIMPGSGGVVRLLWLLGLEKAYPILAEGKRYSAKEALALGLLHDVAPDEEQMLEVAETWLLENAGARQPWDSNGRIPGGGLENPRTAQWVAGANAATLQKTRGHYPAVQAILNTLAEGSLLGFDAATRIESRYFASLVRGQVARNMTKAFWYDLNAINEGAQRPKGFGRFKARSVGIIGSGMMGSGIAYAAACAGIQVVLKDVSRNIAEIGKEYSVKLLAKRVAKGEISDAERAQILDLIHTTDKAEDFSACDLIIEAVFENREIKNKVTKEAEPYLHRETFFASNTSTLPITGLAEASLRPEKFIGLHFFSPVEKMNLVEIICGQKTDDETRARAIDFVQQIRKTPIVVNDSRGFYTSRVFGTYVLEGIAMLLEGQSPAYIEQAGLQTGMPVSPLALTDEVSLSLVLDIQNQARKDLGEAYVPHPALPALEKMVLELDRKGKAKGAGFYEYPANGKKYLWPELSAHFPPSPPLPFSDLTDRLMFVQVLETLRCVKEGVLQDEAAANVGSIFGWGFAPFTGGTLQFVQHYGEADFKARCAALSNLYGERFVFPE